LPNGACLGHYDGRSCQNCKKCEYQELCLFATKDNLLSKVVKQKIKNSKDSVEDCLDYIESVKNGNLNQKLF